MSSARQVVVVCVCGCLLSILSSCSSPKDVNPPAVHFVEDDYANDSTPKRYTVTIAQMKFDPEEIKVKKGDTIVYVNQDMVTHDITEQPDSTWRSGPLPANASWKLVVMKSADYYCSIHPVMKGKITVK